MNGKHCLGCSIVFALAMVAASIIVCPLILSVRFPSLPSWDGVVWLRGTAPTNAGPAMLVFGASWCPDCVAERPRLEALHRTWEPRGIPVIALALQPESELREAIAVADPPVTNTYPLGVSSRALHRACNGAMSVTNIPSAFLIDPKGRICWYGNPGNLEAALSKQTWLP